MTNKEIDAAKMLMMLNAAKLVLAGIEPVGPRMQVSREEMIDYMMQMKASMPEAMCIGNVLGYYTHGEKAESSAKADYPDLYVRVESLILGNVHFKDYLSALADGLLQNGDGEAKRRLVDAGAYVESSSGKSVVLSELGVSGGETKTGCLVPIVLALAVTILGSICGCGSNERSLSEIEKGIMDSFSSQMGIPRSALSVKARSVGSGRWAVQITATRADGQRRSLNATAVMDKNGDIHCYTD